MSIILPPVIGWAFPAAAAGMMIGERSPLDGDDVPALADIRAEPAGIDAGSFRLLPEAGVTAAYDTNVFATPAPRDTEALGIAEAKLAVSHRGAMVVDGRAFVRARRFLDSHDQDTAEHGASAALTLPWNSGNIFDAQVLAQRRFESRIDIETPNERPVSSYDQWQAQLGYTRVLNRLSLNPALQVQRVDHQQETQRYRDLTSYRAEIRGAYALGVGPALTLSSSHDRDDYRHEDTRVVSARSNSALVGMQWSVTDLMEFQFAAGYFRKTYARELGDSSGVTLRGDMTWRPTRLSSVRLQLTREDAPTRIEGAFGKVRSSVNSQAWHDFSRHTVLFARAEFIADEFDGVSRTDRTWLAIVGLNHRISDHLSMAFEYDYASRHSAAADEGFIRHMVGVSFRGGL